MGTPAFKIECPSGPFANLIQFYMSVYKFPISKRNLPFFLIHEQVLFTILLLFLCILVMYSIVMKFNDWKIYFIFGNNNLILNE